ncbi:MAG: DUF1934 domain-containing protein [Lachnospiraceae bacterium]|nr:DUF1934 domain-containing protein [Lachnospiraceae bacterium]
MEGAVLLKITGGQGQIVNTCQGQCYHKNGHHYVLFTEELSEDGGKGKTVFSSRLKISDDQVVLRRSLGAQDPELKKHVMEFVYRQREDADQGCFVDYPSPYGVLRLEIRTDDLMIDKSEEEISLRIKYQMLQEGQEISRDALEILIRKA